MKQLIPKWFPEALHWLIPVSEVLLIALGAWALRYLARRLIARMSARYNLPAEAAIGIRRVLGALIYGVALLWILERLGVSATVLWTAFTGFAAMAAVAFFAAWSVLSNIFCALLILTTRPFRLYDKIELLENGEKPGLRGRVVDINMVYTTLEEIKEDMSGTTLQIPNSLFFQRITRRWK
ncbi:mechanosensitive ion channel family protein [Sinimarinibacterium sp. NLF-5-8]|uniref:mechanosensitive ion channel family protein n=1 Tax=Sinimarinibacterium sp. NLF-5-8 TaxID=2698684 RepID=UPI00137BBC9E|nr:mechanosensitive ion channel family protein [Sinimarinibacterium sp. NLF-5-8]QHS09756.1 mechanosensitive ion channel family protein [Sinimarinibacterium sp. NLF-5-8]